MPNTHGDVILYTSLEESTLQAAREQKILNLKLKEACLEHEDYVRELHESTWSQAQELKLQDAHSKSHELLHAVDQVCDVSHANNLNPSRRKRR